MTFAEGTPERELQDAQLALDAAVERVVRLNGSVPEGFYVQDWAVVGSATKIDGEHTINMWVVPGTTMATYQLHGLLDLVDKWIVMGEQDYLGDDDGE